MVLTDIAIATGYHNWLVIAAALAIKICFKGSEVTTDIGTAKFVVKGGTTNGAFGHNIQRRDDAIRLAVILFPGLNIAGNLQVGHGKAHKPDFRFGAAAHCTFIANFTT